MMSIAQILRDSKQEGDLLVKMFGYWNIVVKQVQTMRKKKAAYREKLMERRKERRKRENSYNYEEPEIPQTKPIEKEKKKKGTWIIEDSNIVDFLESSASSHVVTSNPSKKRKQDDLFPVAEDGRLIIVDPEEPVPQSKAKSQPDLMNDGEDDTDVNEFTAEDKEKEKRRKLTTRLSAPGKPGTKKSKLKKAGGDVKKKNAKYEPYSYIPLKAGQLNKRRRPVAHKAYKDVLSKPSMKGRAIRKR